jgi:hypothetical protein
MHSTLYFCHTAMKLHLSRQMCEIYSNIKFYENPSSGSTTVPCWRKDGRTDTKPIVAFPTSANAPNNCTFCPNCICVLCIYLGINSNFCAYNINWLVFINRNEKCLLCGTKWIFTQNCLRFVFKGLIQSYFSFQRGLALKPYLLLNHSTIFVPLCV